MMLRFALNGDRYEPEDADIRANGISETQAARFLQPVRLLERRGGPIHPRLRAHLWIAGGRVPHELHLRPASIRDGRSGLGRAFPDSGDERPRRSPSTATANKCATSSSSKIWSTPSCSRAETSATLSGQVFNIGGGPHNTTSLLELLDCITDLEGARPQVSWGNWRPGDQRYYVSDFSKFETATGWQPKVGMREGVERLHAWLRESRAAAAEEPTLATA